VNISHLTIQVFNKGPQMAELWDIMKALGCKPLTNSWHILIYLQRKVLEWSTTGNHSLWVPEIV